MDRSERRTGRRRFSVPAWRPPETRSRRRFRLPWVEYLLIRAVETALLSLPYRGAASLSRIFARIVHALDRKRRQTARRNLARAFPEWSPAKVDATAFEAYAHFALVLVELCFTRRLVRASTADRYATFVDEDRVFGSLDRGKGLVMVAGHFGNWELAAYAGALRGMPLSSIARPVDNRRINDRFVGFRVNTGQEVVYKADAMRRMIGVLRENRVAVIPADQNVREGGVFVPFFGRPAATIRSAALLSRKYGAPLLVVNHVRTHPGRFHYRVSFSPPVDPTAFDGAEDPLRELTAHFTRQLERNIREHPEQYLWMHKRWKTRPPEEVRMLNAEVRNSVSGALARGAGTAERLGV